MIFSGLNRKRGKRAQFLREKTPSAAFDLRRTGELGAGRGAGNHQVALELSDSAQHGQDQPPVRGWCCRPSYRAATRWPWKRRRSIGNGNDERGDRQEGERRDPEQDTRGRAHRCGIDQGGPAGVAHRIRSCHRACDLHTTTASGEQCRVTDDSWEKFIRDEKAKRQDRPQH